VPTIGRPASLRRLLGSLAIQTIRVEEVIVADGSADNSTQEVVNDPVWAQLELLVRLVGVRPPNAVRQREVAISSSRGEYLLLLDDDVELEPTCVEEMFKVIQSDASVVAVMADFNNQFWAEPTPAWRAYLRLLHGVRNGEWQGRVIGPLLKFGYNNSQGQIRPLEWLGTGNSLIRKDSFEKSGGFSHFFLYRSTTNEDVDLGYKIRRVGKIQFCPGARLAHYHDPTGRVSAYRAAEDDLFNRFMILHVTMGYARRRATTLIFAFFIVESISNLLGALRRGQMGHTATLFAGRTSALFRITRCLLSFQTGAS
jgi:GT2 family glycosyltransferase